MTCIIGRLAGVKWHDVKGSGGQRQTSGGAAARRTGFGEWPLSAEGFFFGCLVFFSVLFVTAAAVEGACTCACPSPICCAMLTRDTTNGTSAKPQELFQLTAFSSWQLWGDGLRLVGGRMETSGDVDESGRIEMGHDQAASQRAG